MGAGGLEVVVIGLSLLVMVSFSFELANVVFSFLLVFVGQRSNNRGFCLLRFVCILTKPEKRESRSVTLWDQEK